MLYVIVSMLFFFLQNAVNKAFGNHYRADTRLLMLYQLPVHLTMLACLLLMGARLNLPVGGWLLAIGYGMIFLSTITLMTKSLSVGPIGQTTLIVNLSLLLSLIAGVAFFGERMTVCRWLGIPCILLTLILSALGGGDDKKKSGRWLALVLVTMLGDGSLSLVQKTFDAVSRGGGFGLHPRVGAGGHGDQRRDCASVRLRGKAGASAGEAALLPVCRASGRGHGVRHALQHEGADGA